MPNSIHWWWRLFLLKVVPSSLKSTRKILLQKHPNRERIYNCRHFSACSISFCFAQVGGLENICHQREVIEIITIIIIHTASAERESTPLYLFSFKFSPLWIWMNSPNRARRCFCKFIPTQRHFLSRQEDPFGVDADRQTWLLLCWWILLWIPIKGAVLLCSAEEQLKQFYVHSAGFHLWLWTITSNKLPCFIPT